MKAFSPYLQPRDCFDTRAYQAKAEYAATLIFIFTCCLAKLSLLAFLRSLTHVISHRTFNIALGTSIILWTVTSLIPGAFQCALPEPWDHVHNRCFDRVSNVAESVRLLSIADGNSQHAWEYYVSIGNMVTDLGLTLLPLFIVSGLKISRGKKFAVYMAFMSRLWYFRSLSCLSNFKAYSSSVVAALIVQLVFIIDRSGPTNDPSLDIWPVSISTQLVQCLSIVCACTVYLKPFLDSLETGFIQVGGSRRQRTESRTYGSKQSSGITSTLTSIRGKLSSKDRTTASSYPLQDRQRPNDARPVNQVQTHIGPAGSTDHGDWDAHSRSQILQTRTWEIHDETIDEERRDSEIQSA